MPVLGWAFFAVLVAIAIPGYGQLAAVFTLFLLAVPASAIYIPILQFVSAMGLSNRATETVSLALAIALTMVVAGILFFQFNRLGRLDRGRKALANALAVVIGIPVCMGAAYYRAKGMF